VLAYQALGYPTPTFAHIPLILGPDKQRLSKRHGATSVQAFREVGIVPEAMVNYLARLGWSHGDQEIFSGAELAAHFDLAHVGQSAAVFDRAKLEWLSQHWIKQKPAAALAAELRPFLARHLRPEAPGADDWMPPYGGDEWLTRVADTLRERAKTLAEMAERATFYFRRPAGYEAQATAKFWGAEAGTRYGLLIKRLEGQEAFEESALEAIYRGLAAELGLKLVDLAQLTRIALTGTTASPPIFQVMVLLGREETLARLRDAKSAAEGRR
jgi:glutamyl-tRNA synthetase